MDSKKLKTKLIIETPAGQGTELLTDLNDFVDFYNNFSKEQQKYLGICFDTAHTWALGYELIEAYNILFKKKYTCVYKGYFKLLPFIHYITTGTCLK